MSISAVQKQMWQAGRLMQKQGAIGIAIVGAHAGLVVDLIILILKAAGNNPTKVTKDAFVEGSGKYVVVEALAQNKAFLLLAPRILAMLDIPSSDAKIIRPYREFIKLVPLNGFVVINKDAAGAVAAAKSARAKVRLVSSDNPWPGIVVTTQSLHQMLVANTAARICHELNVDNRIIKKILKQWI